MRYIEAPDYNNDPQLHPPQNMSLFLGGGITGCPDWQSDMMLLLNETKLTLYNPRRKNFPIEDPDAAYEQIIWEYHHLRAASFLLFWFPEESICPIALYELGTWTPRKKTLLVGCHPNYPRRQDVVIQTDLARHGLPIYASLPQLADAVKSYL